MATSATSTNETLAFNSNEIKIIEITTILLKILRKHVRDHNKNKKAGYTLTAQVKWRQGRVLPQSYTKRSQSRIAYIVDWRSKRVKWRRKINHNNQCNKHKTKTCNYFKSKQWKSQQSCSKSSENTCSSTRKTKKLATHSPDRSSDVKVVFLPNASQSDVTPASPILLPDDRKGSS